MKLYDEKTIYKFLIFNTAFYNRNVLNESQDKTMSKRANL